MDMGAEVKYSYEVVSGSEIDVFLMDSQQYERYSTWSNLFDMDNMLPGSSLSNMSDHKEVTLPPGSYYLVFDNTDVGPSKAGDRVGLSNDVSFEFKHPEPPPVEIEHLIVFGAIFSLILIVPLTVNHLPTIDVSSFIGEHANAFSLVFSLLGGFLIAYTAFIIAASSSYSC